MTVKTKCTQIAENETSKNFRLIIPGTPTTDKPNVPDVAAFVIASQASFDLGIVLVPGKSYNITIEEAL